MVLLKRAGGLLWKWEQMALAANCTMPQKSMIIFERFNSDKKRSFTYCTSKEVRDLLRIGEVLTFDGHFEQMESKGKLSLSEEFLKKVDNGEMGDDLDFFELERKKEPEIIGYFINSWITSKTKNRELAKIRENITQITDKLTSLDGDGKEGSREIL